MSKKNKMPSAPIKATPVNIKGLGPMAIVTHVIPAPPPKKQPPFPKNKKK